ncbi:MAG: hypothetical protein CMI90_05120 [Pelagibacteraceae bacterium]|nr:hypothetical protein [Pelagibacteraceae bacterium]|tara:strand:- start:4379 stop:4603 length:225 start_codon:yes stop_codon:yes gene_type:complete
MNEFKCIRLKSSVSVEQAAKKLGIHPEVVKDLEKEGHHILSNPFIYFCAKNYAKYLNIDLPEKFLKNNTTIHYY